MLHLLLRHHLWNVLLCLGASFLPKHVAVCQCKEPGVTRAYRAAILGVKHTHTVQCGVRNMCGGEQAQYVLRAAL